MDESDCRLVVEKRRRLSSELLGPRLHGVRSSARTPRCTLGHPTSLASSVFRPQTEPGGRPTHPAIWKAMRHLRFSSECADELSPPLLWCEFSSNCPPNFEVTSILGHVRLNLCDFIDWSILLMNFDFEGLVASVSRND